jgi:hypothetical protein
VAREEICGDGVDNDGDGKTDCADPDCLGAACDSPDAGTTAMNCGVSGATPVCVAREAVCDDNVDNDGDGKTDCADPDCDGKTCAAGKTCKVGVCST